MLRHSSHNRSHTLWHSSFTSYDAVHTYFDIDHTVHTLLTSYDTVHTL